MIVLYDVLRWVGGVAALVVVGATPYALRVRSTWDQRLRFASMAVVAVVLIAANLSALGTAPPAGWRTALITVGIVGAAVGWVAYVLGARKAARGPGGRHVG